MMGQHPIVTPSVGVILGDGRGNWTALCRRQLSVRGIRVHSVETLDAVTHCLETRPWDLVALVLDTYREDELWGWWQLDRERRPAGRICLLGGRDCEEFGWALLEAGCDAWIREPQDIRMAVGVAERYRGTVSFDHLPTMDRILYSLPWPPAS